MSSHRPVAWGWGVKPSCCSLVFPHSNFFSRGKQTLRAVERKGCGTGVHVSMRTLLLSCWTSLKQVCEPANYRPCSVARFTQGHILLTEGKDFGLRSTGLSLQIAMWLLGRSRVLCPLTTAYPCSAVLVRPRFSFMIWFSFCLWPVHRSCLPFSVLGTALCPSPSAPLWEAFLSGLDASTHFLMFPHVQDHYELCSRT